MKHVLWVAAVLLPILVTRPARPAAAEQRCGWLLNPTPSNFSLLDRRGEWLIARQGGYQAEGFDDMPDMSTQGWAETNGHYGYGCACMTVDIDAGQKRITRIRMARPVPLARCRADRTLPRP